MHEDRLAFVMCAVALATVITVIGVGLLVEGGSDGWQGTLPDSTESDPLTDLDVGAMDVAEHDGDIYVAVGSDVSIVPTQVGNWIKEVSVVSVTPGFGLSVQDGSCIGTISDAGDIQITLHMLHADEDVVVTLHAVQVGGEI